MVVPLRYRVGMESWPEGEVHKISHTWRDGDGHAWLVVFDLANLGARIACVGVALRSGLIPQPDQLQDAYPSWREEVDIENPLWQFIDPWPPDPEGISLRPMRAVTLREFPFGATFAQARREHTRFFHNMGLLLNQMSPVTWANDVEAFEQDALSLSVASQKPKRPSKYDDAFLERVATVWKAALAGGEPSPMAVVVRELRDPSTGEPLTPDQAKKLIRRCRDRFSLPKLRRKGEIGIPEPHAIEQIPGAGKRICAHPGCQAQLSKYNHDDYCSLHKPTEESHDDF
jgi:hypothetical protein